MAFIDFHCAARVRLQPARRSRGDGAPLTKSIEVKSPSSALRQIRKLYSRSEVDGLANSPISRAKRAHMMQCGFFGTDAHSDCQRLWLCGTEVGGQEPRVAEGVGDGGGAVTVRGGIWRIHAFRA